MPSIEGALAHCRKIQHEDTKNAVLKIISTKLLDAEHTNDLHQDTITELQRLYSRIGELALEETK